jgi:hypothetical protein
VCRAARSCRPRRRSRSRGPCAACSERRGSSQHEACECTARCSTCRCHSGAAANLSAIEQFVVSASATRRWSCTLWHCAQRGDAARRAPCVEDVLTLPRRAQRHRLVVPLLVHRYRQVDDRLVPTPRTAARCVAAGVAILTPFVPAVVVFIGRVAAVVVYGGQHVCRVDRVDGDHDVAIRAAAHVVAVRHAALLRQVPQVARLLRLHGARGVSTRARCLATLSMILVRHQASKSARASRALFSGAVPTASPEQLFTAISCEAFDAKQMHMMCQ